MDAIFSLEGLTQRAADILTREAAYLSGVEACDVDCAGGFLLLHGSGNESEWLEGLQARARRSGLNVAISPLARKAEPHDEEALYQRRHAALSRLWALSLGVDCAGMATCAASALIAWLWPKTPGLDVLPIVGASLVLLGVLLRALGKLLLRERVSEEPFALIAAVLAAASGHWDVASWILGLYALAQEAYEWTIHRGLRRKRGLPARIPKTATLVVGALSAPIDPGDVPIGALVRVARDQPVPVDGYIETGRGRMDTSAMTGEGEPRHVRPSDAVYAGFLNLSDPMDVRAVRAGGSVLLFELLDAPSEGPAPRTRSAIWLSRILTLGGAIAALVFALPALSGQASWVDARVLLPLCAAGWGRLSGIAYAIYASATRSAAARGIRASAAALAAVSRSKQFLFEKTSVLTQRYYEVTSVMYVQGYSREDILGTAAIAEARSSHPIAQAIRRANKGAPSLQHIEKVEEIPGEGVVCRYAGHTILTGNALLMKRHRVSSDGPTSGTPIYVAVDGTYIGVLMLANPPRDDAAAAMGRLKRLGAARTQLVTGDSRDMAQALYAESGMDAYTAGVRDDGRRAALAERRAIGPTTCVADGMGGSVLLGGSADIAMDGACDDAPIEIASNLLGRVADAVDIGQRMERGAWVAIAAAVAAKALSYAAMFALPLPFLSAAFDAAFALGLAGYALRIVRMGKPDVVKFPRRAPLPASDVPSGVVSVSADDDIPALPQSLEALAPEQREALLREEEEREERLRKEAEEMAEIQKQMHWKPPED